MKASDSDMVRQYSSRNYVEPARRRGEASFRIVAGEVHKGVHLNNRVPLVCQALKSGKFLTENNLVLEKWEGPQSGLGTRVIFTYRFKDSSTGVSSSEKNPFLEARGIAKDVFGRLGGGENFIRKEREQFYSQSSPKKELF